jgi:hypothetical protein
MGWPGARGCLRNVDWADTIAPGCVKDSAFGIDEAHPCRLSPNMKTGTLVSGMHERTAVAGDRSIRVLASTAARMERGRPSGQLKMLQKAIVFAELEIDPMFFQYVS